jgi:drug/metabolite transporter (DMT)-like permease
MLPSLLTTVCFSLSVIFAARSARILGPSMANLARLLLAAGLLAVWAHVFGGGLSGPGLWWFVLSGVVGFGVGDMALFGALSRIGPRLSILLTQCLAAPIGAFTEWLWMGTTLSPAEFGCAAVILGGVAVALAPDHGWEGSRQTFWTGVSFGAIAAAGQALGAVVSRKANALAEISGGPIDGGTAAYQRIIGGVGVTLLAFAFLRALRPRASEIDRAQWGTAIPLVVANACAGPALGVACYQWALRTTATGKVLAIVAISPLVTLLLTWLIDGTRPTQRAIHGSILAVLGVIGLKYFSFRE